MNKNLSLLACICIVSVLVEFQSLVGGPGMFFVGGIICPQASQTCCDRNGSGKNLELIVTSLKFSRETFRILQTNGKHGNLWCLYWNR